MSTQQVRIRSDLLTGQVTLDGNADQVFFKSTVESGDQDSGGNTSASDPAPASFRCVKNTSAANPMYIGKAGVTTATGYKLDPGESFVIAGPAGSGFVGDLWVIGTSGDKLAWMAF